MTDEQLAALEAAAKAATPGPWKHERSHVVQPDGTPVANCVSYNIAQSSKNAAFIAAANSAAILELIAELRQARELCHEHELYIADLERSERMYDHALKSFAELLGEEHDEGWMPEIDILINALHELKDDLRQARAERDWLAEKGKDICRRCGMTQSSLYCDKTDCVLEEYWKCPTKEDWLQAAKEATCRKNA